MVLNDRERVIAWVVGGAVAAAALFYATDWLYLSPRAKLETDIKNATTMKVGNEDLKVKGRQAYDHWATLSIPSKLQDVEMPTRNLIFDLAKRFNFQFSTWSTSNARAVHGEADFQEVTFNAGANTTTTRLGHFLETLETQKSYAVRVDSVEIAARKPGQDDLHVEFTIRALVYLPKKLPDDMNLSAPPATGTSRPANATSRPTGPIASGAGTSGAYVDQSTYFNINSLMNLPLGTLDPGLPLTDETPMEERLRARREYQMDGKKLPKPRFGEEPIVPLPGESMDQAMARRKAEQAKAAETQAAVLEAEMKKQDEARLKAVEEAAPKVLPGETIEQAMERRRHEQDQSTPAPSNLATTQPTTTPATAPSNGGVQ